MAPLAEAEVQRELAFLTGLLSMVRKNQGDLSQQGLASRLGVSATSVTDWESGQESLTVRHLISWSHALLLRLVIVDALGVQIRHPLSRDRGEAWDSYELRRLTGALRNIRMVNCALNQREVAQRAGVGRSSIRHWEALTTPPRALGLIRWAMALDCRIRLARLQPPLRILTGEHPR